MHKISNGIFTKKTQTFQDARALVSKGEFQEALDIYWQLHQQNPDDIDVCHDLGGVLLVLKQYEQALAFFKQVLEMQPDRASAMYNIAHCYKDMERYVEAEQYYCLAYEHGYTDSKNLHLFWGSVLKFLGKFQEAEYHLLEAYDLGAKVQAITRLAGVKSYSGVNDEIVTKASQIYYGLPQDSEQKMQMGFALGKMLDDCGHYEEAFSCFKTANNIAYHDKKCNHVIDQFESEVQQLIQVFEGIPVEALMSQHTPSFTPVFIVGLPRTGTTLVEQIFAGHEDVCAAGELEYCYKVRNASIDLTKHKNKAYPFHYSELTHANIEKLQRFYVYLLDQVNLNKKPFITDKMPDNFFHLGLLSMIFPKMKVIHCRRQPVDNALSMYFTDFSRTWSLYNDLGELSRQYKGYKRLMDFWQSRLDIAILDVAYEDVVADMPTQAKKMIEFCGLPWQESCLQTHKRTRAVRTASVWQARQKVYSSSVGRWKNYEPWIGELIEGVEGL